MKKSLDNVVVKDIKNILLFKPRLLKKLKVNNRKLSKDRKTHFNITATFNIYTLIAKTKNIKSYAEGLTIKLQDFFIKFLVFKGGVSKVI